MKSFAFNYTDSRGHTTDWTIEDWNETGRYIQGVCTAEEQLRTFRKDRINRYLGDGEFVLREPYSPPLSKVEARPEMALTGSLKIRRTELQAMATVEGMLVRKAVAQKLVFLCCGPDAGFKKVESSAFKGCFILEDEALLEMLETEELADECLES